MVKLRSPRRKGDRKRRTAGGIVCTQRLLNPVVDALHPFRRSVLQKNDEFIAAVPDHYRIVAGGLEQNIPHSLQHGVALSMPVSIVDMLEPVDVQHDPGGMGPSFPSLGDTFHIIQ